MHILILLTMWFENITELLSLLIPQNRVLTPIRAQWKGWRYNLQTLERLWIYVCSSQSGYPATSFRPVPRHQEYDHFSDVPIARAMLPSSYHQQAYSLQALQLQLPQQLGNLIIAHQPGVFVRPEVLHYMNIGHVLQQPVANLQPLRSLISHPQYAVVFLSILIVIIIIASQINTRCKCTAGFTPLSLKRTRELVERLRLQSQVHHSKCSIIIDFRAILYSYLRSQAPSYSASRTNEITAPTSWELGLLAVKTTIQSKKQCSSNRNNKCRR